MVNIGRTSKDDRGGGCLYKLRRNSAKSGESGNSGTGTGSGSGSWSWSGSGEKIGEAVADTQKQTQQTQMDIDTDTDIAMEEQLLANAATKLRRKINRKARKLEKKLEKERVEEAARVATTANGDVYDVEGTVNSVPVVTSGSLIVPQITNQKPSRNAAKNAKNREEKEEKEKARLEEQQREVGVVLGGIFYPAQKP